MIAQKTAERQEFDERGDGGTSTNPNQLWEAKHQTRKVPPIHPRADIIPRRWDERRTLKGTPSDKGTREFDALSFEIEREKVFQREENFYIEYEIDSVEKKFGELFRLWDGMIRVGTFYQDSKNRWKANPFYENKQLIRLDRDLSKIFESSEEAIAYIKSTYELKTLFVA